MEDFHVRGAVVAGSRRAVVWDTLARPAHMGGVAELARDLPLTVVYTHGDWDHVWGTAGLTRPWAEILAHEACGARFAGELQATLAERRVSSPGEYDDVVLIPPTRTFRGAVTLDLGGITLELHPLPGHTPDTVVGFVPEWGVLLAGDAVETPLPFLNPGSPAESWMASLEAWAQKLDGWARDLERRTLGPEGHPGAGGRHPLVIPSHGPVGGTELLRQNARYLRKLLSGEEPELSPDLSPFYLQTHEANRTLALEEGRPCP